MRNDYKDRTDIRGVMLDLVDLTPVEDAATEWAHAHDDDRINDYDRLEVGHNPWAILTDADGGHWLVCNEGVAYKFRADECDQTDRPHVHLDLYGRGTRSGDAESISIMPTAGATVTLNDALDYRTGEQIDLADLVRVFGSRLEDNVRSLHRLATVEGVRA